MIRLFCSSELAVGCSVRPSFTSARIVIADTVIAVTSAGGRPACSNGVAPTVVISKVRKAGSITATGNRGIGSASGRQRRE